MRVRFPLTELERQTRFLHQECGLRLEDVVFEDDGVHAYADVTMEPRVRGMYAKAFGHDPVQLEVRH